MAPNLELKVLIRCAPLSEMIFSVRADRLIALLLLLQSRGRMTASQVAAELEISPATARRDLEALSMAGIPVYSQPGRGTSAVTDVGNGGTERPGNLGDHDEAPPGIAVLSVV